MKSSRKIALVGTLVILVVAVGFFSYKYVRNVIVFQTPQPSCMLTLGEERCLANPVMRRNIVAEATKEDRPVVSVPEYSMMWFENVVRGTGETSANTVNNTYEKGKILPIIYLFIFYGVIIASVLIAYVSRSKFNKPEWLFLLTVAILLVITVFLTNAMSYYNLHAAYAMQPRYLLSVVPIFIIASGVALNSIVAHRRLLKTIVVVVILAILTQGGGVITHVLRSEDNWYWQNQTVIEVNNATKDALRPLVKEN